MISDYYANLATIKWEEVYNNMKYWYGPCNKNSKHHQATPTIDEGEVQKEISKKHIH